jgi:hypothetical protein
MRHDPGLAASPPVRYILEVERSGYSSFHLSSAVDGHPPREAAAYGGTSAQEDLLRAYGCSRGARKFFTLISKAGPNVVESAAILTEFVAAPHERWAELAKRMHDTEHAGDDTTERS